MLVLFLKHKEFYEGFRCDSCHLHCNGFGYVCSQCDYRIDVNCGFIPEQITHEAHMNHLLYRLDASTNLSKMECQAWHAMIGTSGICFRCNDCDFYLDSRCALHLPRTIRHKYDKHSLKLSYTPIENHKSKYFCEVCEEDLNPDNWFYHCLECSQSIHSACAPFILKSEQGVNTEDVGGVSMFVNMKFGGVKEIKHHKHPLSFFVGTKSDGDCSFCGNKLQSKLIFKCLQCDESPSFENKNSVDTPSNDSLIDAFDNSYLSVTFDF
ncbi:hypothetical protein L6452_03809 [Arctium lappa]|uniref:Uncharacterized protein n=1 Tax=Arctium lappa TaxID=4217 RepID=A0ACB9FMX1_ARCLA|nr:hypothetical protein L6452_03809 [Arctium lappa]